MFTPLINYIVNLQINVCCLMPKIIRRKIIIKLNLKNKIVLDKKMLFGRKKPKGSRKI